MGRQAPMMPELSCYTTALVDHLGPTAADRLADSVRLWVHLDAPDGALAFSHHDRVDDGVLAYASTGDWATARAALGRQLAEHGSVIVVGNTYHLPWSPQHRSQSVSHWFVLKEHRDGRWRVSDRFAALLPAGEQRPFTGWLDDDTLRAALTPLGRRDTHQHNRDVYALGVPTEVGDPSQYRWLRPGGGGEVTWPGEWLREPAAALAGLRDRFVADGQALDRHADDLWAAARHHGHRLTRRGEPTLAATWAQLPKALRFAADSARRGRPRHGVLTEAFDRLIELTTRTEVYR
ncbi:hypothetical protein [Verrucosispora sp. WMMD573]|uniref:hypothetical protein n=1 Tax=Verrucosispora sp. WMMD573 TaxID=3015149 RepID=UPI00248AC4FD|nr:hypothetical protein [Verrucosispora sp. WMMD573]WBB56015.1 hypothetical protein O7601_08065 [Verrucosispora sp. WMMD573]